METLLNNDFITAIPRTLIVKDRCDYLVKMCADKRILHVGCVDSGMLVKRLEMGKLLHKKMELVANVVGLDVDRDGLAEMESFGFNNIFYLDVSHEEARAIKLVRECMGGCDLIVCGEVLEHVMDMGYFLKGLRGIAREFDAAVVLTVPNAYSLRGLISLLGRKEKVHPDHNCYFSWVTINALLRKAGFNNVERCYYIADLPVSLWKRSVLFLLGILFYPIFPQYSDGLIAICRPADS